jgi:S1/P1 nuclease
MRVDASGWMQTYRQPCALLALLTLAIAASRPVGAWGHQGHETIGAIADSLLIGTDAENQVKKILGGEPLATAALWADCVKGVSDRAPYQYHLTSRYRECDPFQQSTAGREEMEDYVRRNATACRSAASTEICHKAYHYTDVAIEHDTYDRADVGTSDHDVVSAINAAIAKLRGQAVPAPFSFESKKEALRVLAHLVGDVHQPLHVGAVYLDAAGHEVDPDVGDFDPSSRTRGGNLLIHGRSRNLHAEWDSIPRNLDASRFLSEGVTRAKAVPATTGPVSGWARAWAGETVGVSRTAFDGLSFGAEEQAGTRSARWAVAEPASYASHRAELQKLQLVRAGARLAQLLQAVLPSTR